jgi:hypothetical protein
MGLRQRRPPHRRPHSQRKPRAQRNIQITASRSAGRDEINSATVGGSSMSALQKTTAIGVLAFLCLSQSAVGQTAQQLASRFRALSAYEIRPGVFMFSKFDTKGQRCEAIVEPLRQGSDSKTQHLTLSNKLADELIEEIAPVESRGAASRFLDPDSTVAGGVYELKTNYKFVSIEKMGNFPQNPADDTIQVIRITWTTRSCSQPK